LIKTPAAAAAAFDLIVHLPLLSPPRGYPRQPIKLNTSMSQAIPFRRVTIWASVAFVAFQLQDFFGVRKRGEDNLGKRISREEEKS